MSKSSVRILNTENLLTSHINPTSVNLKRLSVVMMSGKWDFALFLLNGGLPDLSVPFIISQMTSENLYTTSTPMILTKSDISLIPAFF